MSGITATSASKASSSGCPFANRQYASIANKDPTLTIPQAFRHASLTPEQKALVKASVPALQAKGLDITALFYKNMLNAHPELREVFNKTNQIHLEQPRALANAVLAYAENIDDLTPLGPAVELIAHKHASLHIRPEQYQIVGTHLIAAIAEVLGDAVTAELGEAWTKAYWMLAEVLMNRENSLYKETKGWDDWAEFRIVKKVKESDEIMSFHLEPVDEALKPLPSFLPGQFISIQIDVPELGHKQTRQYSLSDQPNAQRYRVSIKREAGTNAVNAPGVPGIISNLMHHNMEVGDIINLSHPHGDFFMDSKVNPASPVVLLSGGVGLTPMTSMINSLVSDKSTRPISWVHGARSHASRPFTQQITAIGRDNANVQVTMFTDGDELANTEGVQHCKGYLDLSKLDQDKELFINDEGAQYYICGPMPFMLAHEKTLLAKGVDASRIHMEKFGMGGVPRSG